MALLAPLSGYLTIRRRDTARRFVLSADQPWKCLKPEVPRSCVDRL